MSYGAKLTVWTLFVAAVTYVLTLAFVAPRQADARAEIPPPAVETPTVEHTLEGAKQACTALTERLDQMDMEWAKR